MARRSSDRTDPDDVRAFGDVLGAGLAGRAECAPPMDIIETTSAIEVIVDLPGVAADALRITFARGALVIAGEKVPGTCPHGDAAAFHLAERSFGQFARVIRLTGAYDAGAARARLASGVLHVVLPRVEERRGREIPIPVQAG